MRFFQKRHYASCAVILATALPLAGCFQTTTFRSGKSVNNQNLDSGGGSDDGSGDSGAAEFVPVTGTISGYLFPPFSVMAPTGSGSTPASNVPVREISGSGCRFKIRKLDAEQTVVKTIDLGPTLGFIESDLITVLRETDEIMSKPPFSETYADYFKMTGYQGGWGYASPGAFINPVFKGKLIHGARSGSGGSSSPVHPDDTVPELGVSQFVIEVQGGDASSCGFDFRFENLKHIRKTAGAAWRDLKVNLGPWTLANDAGDLRLPVCGGVSSSIGATGGFNTCQSQFAQANPSPVYYTIFRDYGARGNRFTIQLGAGGLTIDQLKFRFWGYSPSFLFGNRWNPTATTSANRCDVVINSTSDLYNAGTSDTGFTGFPIGKTFKEMCKYSSWFWDTQH